MTDKELHAHYAGLAMQGLCANSGGPFQSSLLSGWGIVNCKIEDVAGVAFDIADAMMKVKRERGEK